MTRLTLLLLLIAACWRQPPPASPPPPAPGPALVTRPDGRTYAVIHFLPAREGDAAVIGTAGGMFEIDDPATVPQPVAPGGGHADAIRYFVAEIGFPVHKPWNNAASDGHWATMSVHPFAAEALGLVPMPDLATARARLPELARTGMPDAIPVSKRSLFALPR